MRFLNCESASEFITNRWNIFDILIISTGFIPFLWTWLGGDETYAWLFRVLSVFQALRLLRTIIALRLLVSVIADSLKRIINNLIFICLIVFIFAFVGVELFRLPEMTQVTTEQLVALGQLRQIAPWPTSTQDAPYNNISEAIFTLIRCMSGDAWSDVRYQLCAASRLGLLKVPEIVVTLYHIIWYIISALLLLNIILGVLFESFMITMKNIENQKEVNSISNVIFNIYKGAHIAARRLDDYLRELDKK